MPRLPLAHRSLATRLVLVGGFVTFLLMLYTMHPSSARIRSSVSDIFSARQRSECTPQDWASGQWVRRVSPRTSRQNATSVADVLEFQGFEGCASDREYKWHLAAEDDQLDRYPEVTAYEWTPPPTCKARRFDREAFVQDLVEKGGWLLLGGKSMVSSILLHYLHRCHCPILSPLPVSWLRGAKICTHPRLPCPCRRQCHELLAFPVSFGRPIVWNDAF